MTDLVARLRAMADDEEHEASVYDEFLNPDGTNMGQAYLDRAAIMREAADQIERAGHNVTPMEFCTAHQAHYPTNDVCPHCQRAKSETQRTPQSPPQEPEAPQAGH